MYVFRRKRALYIENEKNFLCFLGFVSFSCVTIACIIFYNYYLILNIKKVNKKTLDLIKFCCSTPGSDVLLAVADFTYTPTTFNHEKAHIREQGWFVARVCIRKIYILHHEQMTHHAPLNYGIVKCVSVYESLQFFF